MRETYCMIRKRKAKTRKQINTQHNKTVFDKTSDLKVTFHLKDLFIILETKLTNFIISPRFRLN